ncbi:MAG: DUF1015 family protein [Candidatus Zipacnadales bacterium]
MTHVGRCAGGGKGQGDRWASCGKPLRQLPMPLVRPFQGLRYAPSRISTMAHVLAPPFDMIRGEERRALFSLDEHNFARLTAAEDAPGYPTVAALFHEWRQAGILERDLVPSLYVYEQAAGKLRLQGFLGAVRLVNPPECAIYGHEKTFAQPITDRLALMRATDCMIEPVLGLYTDPSKQSTAILASVMERPPLWEATTEGAVVHRLWRVEEPPTQQALCEAVAQQKVVIADGHHRWAAANAYREEWRAQSAGLQDESPWEFGLMLLVEATKGGLCCGAFHRVIRRLPDHIDPAKVVKHLGPGLEVQEFPSQGLPEGAAVGALMEYLAAEGSEGPVFGCRWDSGAAVVRIRDLEGLLSTTTGPLDALLREFDVALLHRLILRARLGCTGDYSPQLGAVTFEKDPVVAWREVSAGTAIMAWFVNPAQTEAVMRAAFAGLKVPQKATHFYPKPPSGMVIYDLRQG